MKQIARPRPMLSRVDQRCACSNCTSAADTRVYVPSSHDGLRILAAICDPRRLRLRVLRIARSSPPDVAAAPRPESDPARPPVTQCLGGTSEWRPRLQPLIHLRQPADTRFLKLHHVSVAAVPPAWHV